METGNPRSPNLQETYDALYSGAYRGRISGFEWARRAALAHFIPAVAGVRDDRAVLDYGAGSGLYVDLWRSLFPRARLSCSEISPVALQQLRSAHPDLAGNCHPILDHRAEIEDGQFDVVISVEVMEHVEDLRAYLRDVHRLLAPGGVFVWTTPCANAGSIEHLFNLLTRQIDATAEGYRRWRWEDPTHLRRLKSREIGKLLAETGFDDVRFRFRSHLISFLLSSLPSLMLGRMNRRPTAPVAGAEDQPPVLGGGGWGALERARGWLIGLDYRFFRRMPNGASMLGCARKPMTRMTGTEPLSSSSHEPLDGHAS